MYIRIHVYMSICVYLCMYMYICIYVSMCICVYAYMCICRVYVFICLYICVYVYIRRTCLVAPMQLNTNIIRRLVKRAHLLWNVRNFCETCTTAGKRAQHLWHVHTISETCTTSLKRAHIEYLKTLGGGGETRYARLHICIYIYICMYIYIYVYICIYYRYMHILLIHRIYIYTQWIHKCMYLCKWITGVQASFFSFLRPRKWYADISSHNMIWWDLQCDMIWCGFRLCHWDCTV